MKTELNGQDVGWFIVDTGAPHTVVGEDVVERLALSPLAAGADGSTRVIPVDRLRIGNLLTRPRYLQSIDLHHVRAELGAPIGGIVGNDLLEQLPFEIDYRAATLTFFDRDHFQPPPARASAYPLRLVLGLPLVPGKIDGREAWFLVDTGSAFALRLFHKFIDEQPDLMEQKPQWSSSAIGVDGPMEYTRTRLERLEILGKIMSPVAASYGGRPTTNDYPQHGAGYIGAHVLEDASAVFDYQHQRAWVQWLPKESSDEMMRRLGDPRTKDLFGQTPLMRAVQAGRTEVVARLIEAGADVNAATNDGRTALIFAAAAGSADLVELLLSKGADPSAETVRSETALHYAASGIDADCIRTLLRAGAKPDPVNTRAETPLFSAAEGGRVPVAEALIAGGADVNALARDGTGALTRAAWHGCLPMIELLLKKNARAWSTDGSRALMAAATGDHSDIIETLLTKGADPNAALGSSRRAGSSAVASRVTALMIAAEHNHSASADILLRHGADARLRDSTGKTAWDLAVTSGAVDVMRVPGLRPD